MKKKNRLWGKIFSKQLLAKAEKQIQSCVDMVQQWQQDDLYANYLEELQAVCRALQNAHVPDLVDKLDGLDAEWHLFENYLDANCEDKAELIASKAQDIIDLLTSGDSLEDDDEEEEDDDEEAEE